MLHAWWGLNSDTKALCTRLADAGFVAYAPDLFEGKTATTEDEAETLVRAAQPKDAEIRAKVVSAMKLLLEGADQKEIGVVGLSFGAYYALELSNDEPKRVRTVVVFYGTGAEDFEKSRASYLGHFAENDEFEPKESVEGLTKLLRDADRPAMIHTYPGTGHWFFEPGVKKAYDKEASDLAWERTLRFLRETLPNPY